MKMVAIQSSILFSSPLGRSLQGEYALRSTCGGRWRGRTRRTPAWRSTSAGRWRGKPGWSLRSRRSTSSRGSDDLDLDGGGSQGGDLLLHAVSNTGVHGGAAGHDGVGVQVLPDVPM